MPPVKNRVSWEQKIERARELAETYPFASQLLLFYAQVAAFQQRLQERWLSSTGVGRSPIAYLPFRDALDAALLLPAVPKLLSFVAQAGPAALAQAAHEATQVEPQYWEYLLGVCWKNEDAAQEAPEAHRFFARALLEPYAAQLAGATEAEFPRHNAPTCPLCSSKPVAGVLREEAHGARRSLLCSLCATEWDYPRITCPACGEATFDRLAVYTAKDREQVRVEACESCKTYLKAVDLSKNGLAVPVVDELAAVDLDLWAREKGYTKLQSNLLGM